MEKFRCQRRKSPDNHNHRRTFQSSAQKLLKAYTKQSSNNILIKSSAEASSNLFTAAINTFTLLYHERKFLSPGTASRTLATGASARSPSSGEKGKKFWWPGNFFALRFALGRDLAEV